MKAAIIYTLFAPTAAFMAAPSTKSVTGTALFAENSRRTFLTKVTAATATATATLSLPTASFAAEEDGLVDVYFGVGCYWHIQHEFVEAERKLLSRGDKDLTSRTGYAGGTSTDKEGRVCYHNFQGVADYGKLGHGEVVGMKVSLLTLLL